MTSEQELEIRTALEIFKNSETLWSLFVNLGFTGFKFVKSLWGLKSVLTTKFLGVPDTHLINLGRMKGWVTYWFWTWYCDGFCIISMIWNGSMSNYIVTSTKLRGEICLWNYSLGGTHTQCLFWQKKFLILYKNLQKHMLCRCVGISF